MQQSAREFMWIVGMGIGIVVLAPICWWLFPRQEVGLMRVIGFILVAFVILVLCVQIIGIVSHHGVVRKHLSKTPVSDAEFLARCDLSGDAQRRTGLAVRMALAQVSGIPSELITADDCFKDRFWDSLDWLDITFRVERTGKVKIPKGAVEEALRLAGGQLADLQVKHVARAFAVMALPGNAVTT